MFRILLYLVLVLLGIVFSILYSQYQVALFVGILLLFPILSAIISVIPCLFLKVSIVEQEAQVHRDETFKIYIKIKNPTIIPITFGQLDFSFRYDVLKKWNKRKLSFQLRGRDESICVLTMKSEYCGTLDILLKRVWIKDFFRVFLIGKWVKKGHRQVILPKLQTLRIDVPKTISFYNEEYEEFYEDHPGNDPSEVFDIREYKEGDSLQRVHWKLSSKKDKLMVKEFSDPIVVDTVILCDNFACVSRKKMQKRILLKKKSKEFAFLKEWSALIEKTIQASYSLILQGVIHYVYWFDGEDERGVKRAIRNIEDLNQCMKELLRSQPYLEINKYIGYLIHSEQIQKYKNVYYIGHYHYEFFQQSGISAKVVE